MAVKVTDVLFCSVSVYVQTPRVGHGETTSPLTQPGVYIFTVSLGLFYPAHVDEVITWRAVLVKFSFHIIKGKGFGVQQHQQ